MGKIDFSQIKNELKGYFNLSDYLVPQEEAEQSIREGVSFKGSNLWILIIAILMASVGLNINSTAILIGAMLISPLMGPIIGMGLAVGVHDFDLMKLSFRNLFMAAAFSVLASCIYFLISPVNEGHSELLARTSPSIYDVLIGFFGGAAGIVATGSRVKGNVIPGVAIATALMPPLCTVGYGLATMQMKFVLGAFYLFFINSVFIACATTVGVKLMHYKLKDFSNPQRAKRVRTIVYTIATLTMVPACYMTYVMFEQNNFNNNCEAFVAKEFNFAGTTVLNYKAVYERNDKQLNVSLVGRPVATDSLLLALNEKLSSYDLAGTHLHIQEGTVSDGAEVTRTTSQMLGDMYKVTQATIERQQAVIDSLQSQRALYTKFDTVSATLAPELRVLFPQIRDIAVSQMVNTNVEIGRSDTVNVAIVKMSRQLDASNMNKFTEYLEARLKLNNIRVIQSDAIAQ